MYAWIRRRNEENNIFKDIFVEKISEINGITEEEALRILKELNPTYLKEVEKENTKRLRLFK